MQLGHVFARARSDPSKLNELIDELLPDPDAPDELADKWW